MIFGQLTRNEIEKIIDVQLEKLRKNLEQLPCRAGAVGADAKFA